MDRKRPVTGTGLVLVLSVHCQLVAIALQKERADTLHFQQFVNGCEVTMLFPVGHDSFGLGLADALQGLMQQARTGRVDVHLGGIASNLIRDDQWRRGAGCRRRGRCGVERQGQRGENRQQQTGQQFFSHQGHSFSFRLGKQRFPRCGNKASQLPSLAKVQACPSSISRFDRIHARPRIRGEHQQKTRLSPGFMMLQQVWNQALDREFLHRTGYRTDDMQQCVEAEQRRDSHGPFHAEAEIGASNGDEAVENVLAHDEEIQGSHRNRQQPGNVPVTGSTTNDAEELGQHQCSEHRETSESHLAHEFETVQNNCPHPQMHKMCA
ncbi:hypothetical protein WR25_25701 [Diploscapter pachys]|uniref:Receptor ligand binding region domain-containing protein n=1 Tax=Diploscapter pachys TaxID=2018661 RepID=A0A2A2K6Q3_9BILA|nr:hypothetical protein WR25_25701 [Diploscapter pachys]